MQDLVMDGDRNVDGFDIDALYAALDAKRRERELSWQGAAREISGQFAGAQARPISASTLTGMRGRRALEGDGVLQVVRWLGRTPESFVPGNRGAEAEGTKLPDLAPDRILRFDTKAIYARLDEQRAERGLTWKEVAGETGCGAASLTGLRKGGRIGFPDVMRIARWLGEPVASLTHASEW